MTQTRMPELGPITDSTRRPHRVRWLVVIAGVLVIVLAGAAWIVRYRLDDAHRNFLSSDGWPSQGQGAYRVGEQTPRASDHQHAVPIASLAKVMTAVVVLARHPLAPGEAGPSITVTAADVADTAARRARDESIVDVRAGERLSERDALMALLLPSANNVAVILARFASGDVPAFVAQMNRTARRLGMTDTDYTDPSGFDPGTVSTAYDQLLLAEAAAADPTLSAVMRTRSYSLPVAGAVHNTDSLLGQGGFVGMKTGSDDAAGGCFMFRAYRSVDGIDVQVIGVVLGQHGHHLITAGLYAGRELVDRLAPTPAHP